MAKLKIEILKNGYVSFSFKNRSMWKSTATILHQLDFDLNDFSEKQIRKIKIKVKK